MGSRKGESGGRERHALPNTRRRSYACRCRAEQHQVKWSFIYKPPRKQREKNACSTRVARFVNCEPAARQVSRDRESDHAIGYIEVSRCRVAELSGAELNLAEPSRAAPSRAEPRRAEPGASNCQYAFVLF